ncbi:hypothetical protein TEA_015336 [Camellia sinensis var. sinensis]|uniref:Uncharacterized protein n=1 Tax=Camellia sinensis var. sinensis TaxID=542762 RepID=A0A4S4DZA5_CAMSN|nr:hypothetical protein TEA_015336 [Camellia sinensis var. sinensis]
MGSSVRTVEGKLSQNVVVMRHGDRIDNFEPLWSASAARPWDPPLVDAGLVRAFCTGRKFRTQLGFPIHCVFVSPFLRCLQTASQVIGGAGDWWSFEAKMASSLLHLLKRKKKFCGPLSKTSHSN